MRINDYPNVWKKHNKGVSSSILLCKLKLLFHPLITLQSKLIDLTWCFRNKPIFLLLTYGFVLCIVLTQLSLTLKLYLGFKTINFHPVHELHSYLVQTDMNTPFAFLSSHYIWYILLVPGDTGILKCSFLPDYNPFNASCSYLSSVALKNNLYIRSTQ